MDQITVERIDSSHATEDQSHGDVNVSSDSDCYEVECLMPAEEEVIVEEDEDNVYIIELSNAEEEGESYKFTITVDQSPQTEKAKMKHLVVRENQRAPASFGPHRPRRERSQRSKMEEEKEKDDREEELVSNKRILKNRDCKDIEINSGSGKKLECHVCPPGRFFKKPTGLASHLREVHKLETKKTYLCTSCNQRVCSQTKLDAHTRHHAKRDTVFTCPICSAETGNKAGFRGQRGLSVHIRNHDKKEEEKTSETPPPTSGAKTESSETDDSDF